MDCDFDNQVSTYNIPAIGVGKASHRYQVGGFGAAVADASCARGWPTGVEIPRSLQPAGGLRLGLGEAEGPQAPRLIVKAEEEDPARVRAYRYSGVGWHTFRHMVGTMLAEMGQHQFTIRDYLRHSNLHVTNKYLQATSSVKRPAQDKLVDAILPTGWLPAPKLIQ